MSIRNLFDKDYQEPSIWTYRARNGWYLAHLSSTRARTKCWRLLQRRGMWLIHGPRATQISGESKLYPTLLQALEALSKYLEIPLTYSWIPEEER